MKSLISKIMIIGAASVLAACSANPEASSEKTAVATNSMQSKTPDTLANTANQVEIALVNALDGKTSHYCLDIMGGGNNIKVEEGLQAHTCYSYKGALGKDQVFDTSRIANKQFYMPNFNVCMVANNLSSGQKLDLANCDNGSAQQFDFGKDGTIRPVASSELCVTASGETTYGRSQKHQKKALTLESCRADLASKQQWFTRTSAN